MKADYAPAASKVSRTCLSTLSKLLKSLVFIVTASTVLYCFYVRSPWLLAPNQYMVRESFRSTPARELRSQAAASSVVDHDLQIGDKSAFSLHKNSDPEEADHASLIVGSAHAQKRNTGTGRQQCVPVGGHASTVRVLGRRLEKCLPEWKPEALTSNFSPDDINITVKTTEKNHKTRMLPVLLTWLQTVQPEQVSNIINTYTLNLLAE